MRERGADRGGNKRRWTLRKRRRRRRAVLGNVVSAWEGDSALFPVRQWGMRRQRSPFADRGTRKGRRWEDRPPRGGGRRRLAAQAPTSIYPPRWLTLSSFLFCPSVRRRRLESHRPTDPTGEREGGKGACCRAERGLLGARGAGWSS